MIAHPVVSWARPQTRETYDEARERPKVCGCGRHHVVGYWTRPYCPWKSEPAPGRFGAIWSQPEHEACE